MTDMDQNQYAEWMASFAKQHQSQCKRGSVVANAFVYKIDPFNGQQEQIACVAAGNNPVFEGVTCRNQESNCGCMHAEERMVIALVKSWPTLCHANEVVIASTCSPCERCANLIIWAARDMSIPITQFLYLRMLPHHPHGPNRLKEAGIPCLLVS